MPYSQEKVNKDLQSKATQDSEFQKCVLEELNKYIKSSSDKMSTYWESWDEHNRLYRGYIRPDLKDEEAQAKKEPVKIIVPVSYAQVQTALSFVFSTFAQRASFYELVGTGPEDQGAKALAMETDLQYQLYNQQFMLKLYLWLLDAFKYGFGITKTSWIETSSKMRVRVPKGPGPLQNVFNSITGQEPDYSFTEEIQDVVQYQGNQIEVISPYSFFPDPNFGIHDFQKGTFVAYEEETDMRFLQQQEGREFFGTKHISERFMMDKTQHTNRHRRAGRFFNDSDPNLFGTGHAKKGVVRTEFIVHLTPSEFKKRKVSSDLIGDENYPVKFLVVVANDSKIIKFEPYGYLHDRFPTEIIEYAPDKDQFLNFGLIGTIYELQNTISWFINSHIVNVRQALRTRFIGNEQKIHSSDLLSDTPLIRTRDAVADVGKVLKQVDVKDVTASHIQDVANLMQFLQQSTGINENALGQFHSGRRSATEARNVNAGASARLKMHAQLAWEQGIRPLGGQLLSNTRQGRTQEIYEQIVGAKAMKAPYDQTILAQPGQLAGGYDFVPYDATLPSDKQFQAGILTQLFEVLVQNPESIPLLGGVQPALLMDHILNLYGIKNIDEFKADPTQLQLPQTQVVPDEVAAQAAAEGAQPVPMAGENLLAQLSGQ
jgi:hypothetical protein